MKKFKVLVVCICLAVVLVITGAGCGKSGGGGSSSGVAGSTLNVMTWGDYIDWAIPAFEEQYNVKVNLDYYNSEQEAINKIKAGRKGSVDIVFLGSGHELQAYNQGLTTDIDVSKLTNFKDLYPFFQESSKDPTVNAYISIPYDWGTNSFMYNADKVTGVIDSWETMYDPQYAGKISLLDRAEMQYWYTCLALGIDMNDGSDATFAAVRAKLSEQLKLNKTLWATGDDIIQYMLNEEVWLAHTDSGRAYRLQQLGKNVKYVIPKEGAQGWFDCLCLCADAPNPELAMLFIDYMIGMEAQVGCAENVQYSISNQKAAESLSDEMIQIICMEGDVDATLRGLSYCKFMGVDWNTKVNEMWTELKAEAGTN